MLLLRRQLSDARTNHNGAVLALRQSKRGLVTRLNTLQAQLEVVNKQLGITGGVWPSSAVVASATAASLSALLSVLLSFASIALQPALSHTHTLFPDSPSHPCHTCHTLVTLVPAFH